MNCKWKGKGVNEKCYHKGEAIIEISEAYFRPLEVDTLLGDYSKAKKELKWHPQTNIHKLIEEMIEEEFNHISD